ncbi:MAG: baseplate J/gp47 family protein [Alphaproteobacteria bacterium]|nr:baseplate J/gp47 family protein [Alphaproteobacteria bacterium]
MAIDLSKLPVPDAIEAASFDAIVAKLVADAKMRIGDNSNLDHFDTTRLDCAAEPMRILIEAFAYREYLLRQRVNDAVRGVMLASATGNDLENLAALYGIKRNTYEIDDALRIRTRDATETLTNAGTASSYRAHANQVNATYTYENSTNDTQTATIGTIDYEIADGETFTVPITPHDTATTSPKGGVVDVKVIGAWAPNAPFAKLANTSLSTTINTEIDSDTIRQLTDTVQVTLGTVRRYKATATLTIGEGPTASAVEQAAETALRAFAFDAYAIGQDVPRNGIIAALWQEGVENLSLTLSVEGGDNNFTLAQDTDDIETDDVVDAYFLTDISITTKIVTS